MDNLWMIELADSEAILELFERINAIVRGERSVLSHLLSASADMITSIIDKVTVNIVDDVLFTCYDAVLHAQNWGSRITLQQQLESDACLDTIRAQKALLAGG